VLVHIVQRAAARPLATFLAEEIFGPLGMTATFAGNAGGRDQIATGYSHGQPVTPYDVELTNMGANDVWSTTSDVAK
jgi:CubicO group peptidase (beta-lactamase class C family)